MSEFIAFSKAVHVRYNELAKHELFVVEPIDIFESYLAAFPEGTNPVFRTNTEHDCSCCKNFIRNLGRVVAIIDGELATVWDNWASLPHPYDVVAKTLADLVRQSPIVSVYRTKERQYGAELTRELVDGATRQWNHFHGKVTNKHFSATPDKDRGDVNTVAQVFKRGLSELKVAAFDDVLDLIDAKALYRGEEWKKPISDFRQLIRNYEASANRELFVWANLNNKNARFRNTAIGTLLVDISDGVELDKAVRSFEAKVAPENYKRPTALITPKMIESAVETLKELGLESAVQRRFAKLSDVSINNVLFVDNSVQSDMKDGLAGLLMEAVKPVKVDTKKAQQIKIEDFFETVVPNTKRMELVLKNDQLSNFVSLTAPAAEDTNQLFKWDNDFAWSYDGEVTDSLRQKVAAAGGRVDGVFRFSHSWNYDKRNASLMDLHVFLPGNAHRDGAHDNYGSSERVGWNYRNHPRTGGRQDVDYTAAAPEGYVPVENITFPNLSKMPEGKYVCKVHNWQLRQPTKGGFKAEIEFAGQVFEYEYDKAMGQKEWVTVAEVTLKNGVFTIEHKLPSSTSSREKWGVTTETLVPVDTIMLSPNHWDEQAVGNKHWFFMLKGCRNPDPVRGIYNEFLRSSLEPHRKVFEVLGSKTKCEPTPDQLSGVGFSSTRNDKVIVVADNRPYELEF